VDECGVCRCVATHATPPERRSCTADWFGCDVAGPISASRSASSATGPPTRSHAARRGLPRSDHRGGSGAHARPGRGATICCSSRGVLAAARRRIVGGPHVVLVPRRMSVNRAGSLRRHESSCCGAAPFCVWPQSGWIRPVLRRAIRVRVMSHTPPRRPSCGRSVVWSRRGDRGRCGRGRTVGGRMALGCCGCAGRGSRIRSTGSYDGGRPVRPRRVGRVHEVAACRRHAGTSVRGTLVASARTDGEHRGESSRRADAVLAFPARAAWSRRARDSLGLSLTWTALSLATRCACRRHQVAIGTATRDRHLRADRCPSDTVRVWCRAAVRSRVTRYVPTSSGRAGGPSTLANCNGSDRQGSTEQCRVVRRFT
jgi:hypothetical protein